MQRFEYRVESFAHAHGGHNATPGTTEFLARANALGAEGWLFMPFPVAGVFLFCRPKPGED